MEHRRSNRPRNPRPIFDLSESKTAPPPQKKKKKKKTQKDYSKEYRDRLKKNAELYRHHREMENKRNQDYRARRSDEARQRNRGLQRIRQQKYRERLKGKDIAQERKVNSSDHGFPFSREEVLQKWIVNMRRVEADGRPWMPTKYTRLCSAHFESECFDRTGQTTRLRQDAMPTIFNYPEPLQIRQTTSSKRSEKSRRIRSVTVSDPSPSTAISVAREHDYAQTRLRAGKHKKQLLQRKISTAGVRTQATKVTMNASNSEPDPPACAITLETALHESIDMSASLLSVDKSHVCPLCSTAFRMSDSLRVHMVTFHGADLPASFTPDDTGVGKDSKDEGKCDDHGEEREVKVKEEVIDCDRNFEELMGYQADVTLAKRVKEEIDTETLMGCHGDETLTKHVKEEIDTETLTSYHGDQTSTIHFKVEFNSDDEDCDRKVSCGEDNNTQQFGDLGMRKEMEGRRKDKVDDNDDNIDHADDNNIVKLGFVGYMPREEKNKECKYSFDLEEESSSSTGTGRKQSVWQRKVQKIEEKGPGALDHFRIAEKERLRILRSNFNEEQKQRIRELQRKRQMEYRKRKTEKRRKAFPGGAVEKKKMEETARRQKRYDSKRKQGKNRCRKTAKREKHCDYMRQWRENQSAEKRKEYNRKRMVRYYKKKREHCSTELVEAEKQSEPDQASPAANSSLGSPCNTPEVPCRMALATMDFQPSLSLDAPSISPASSSPATLQVRPALSAWVWVYPVQSVMTCTHFWPAAFWQA